MRYIGSKTKLAKHLLPIMLKDREPDQYWVEPFVGGANMICRVDGLRIGNDIHKYTIALFKALQNGWIPPTDISLEQYHEIKKNMDSFSPELCGFVGFMCSFGGKWWGGYAHNTAGRNYAFDGSRGMTRQAVGFAGVDFRCGDYRELDIPENSIIYCDPPYEGTTKYSMKFNHKEFWDWCRTKDNEGHTVFVSEYNAPDDYECLIQLEHKTILNKNKQDPRIEKLFKLKK